MNSKVYDIVTDRLLARMDQGEIPWHQPWNGFTVPRNAVSGQPYHGINVLLLAGIGGTVPAFLTFNQAKKMGGTVRKGEKGHLIVYWSIKHKNEKTGEYVQTIPKGADRSHYSTRPILRYYYVFHISQCDGLNENRLKLPELPETMDEFNPIEAAQRIVDGYEIEIKHSDHGGAYYAPQLDYIHMPSKELFKGEPEYYSTLFHEMIHSTGHATRLSREGITDNSGFASHSYSFEELVAEFGNAFLCGISGIIDSTLDNSAAYIQSWSRKLRHNPKWAVMAASQAQKAADFIQGEAAEAAEAA